MELLIKLLTLKLKNNGLKKSSELTRNFLKYLKGQVLNYISLINFLLLFTIKKLIKFQISMLVNIKAWIKQLKNWIKLCMTISSEQKGLMHIFTEWKKLFHFTVLKEIWKLLFVKESLVIQSKTNGSILTKSLLIPISPKIVNIGIILPI